jgi:transposase
MSFRAGEVAVQVIYERCAALDVGKSIVVACVRRPRKGGGREHEVRTFKTFLHDLEALRDWLAAEQVTHVVMEATGSYWRPIWYVLEDAGFELLLVNARHVKQVPGRKTDVKDAVWLAELLECGLLASSFVPPPVIRELRDLTRYRKRLIQDRTREAQRVDKVLQDAAIKLGSVASEILGESSRAMIEALIAGERDPQVLADLAKGRLRDKTSDLVRALHGRFGQHHAMLLRLHLDHIDHLDAAITTLDDRVDELIRPFATTRDLLITIPGVGKRVAEVILAEIGADMSVFSTDAHLASWAGVSPGNNSSAGKHYSGRRTKGDGWLLDALTQAAWAAARTKDDYLSAQFWRFARRIGKKKAVFAVAHSILVVAYHVIDTGQPYHNLGADYFTKRVDPERRARQLTRQLHDLGYEVTLTTAA